MKQVVWKAYWNYEKEEEWLNRMAAMGLKLTDYSWCRYVFEDCEKGEYTFRIELLEHNPMKPEGMAYIRFLEETGIEFVASYFHWVYFCKKTKDGPFDIYSDTDSKLKHYKRILRLWNAMAVLELSIGAMNVALNTMEITNGAGRPGHLLMGFLLIAFGVFFITIGNPVRKKVKRLLKNKSIME